MDKIEKAYREGYAEGYSQGEEDISRFDIGEGKIRPSTRKKNIDRAWDSSKAKNAIVQPPLPLPESIKEEDP